MSGFTSHIDNLYETNVELNTKLQKVKNELKMF